MYPTAEQFLESVGIAPHPLPDPPKSAYKPHTAHHAARVLRACGWTEVFPEVWEDWLHGRPFSTAQAIGYELYWRMQVRELLLLLPHEKTHAV